MLCRLCQPRKRGILRMSGTLFRAAARALREGRVVMPNCLKLPSPLHLFVILPVVAAGAIAASSAAFAEPQEIKLVEHATTDAVTNTGASGDSAGDILTFSNEVYDADDKIKVGSDQGHLLPYGARQSLGVLLDAEPGEGSIDGRGAVLR